MATQIHFDCRREPLELKRLPLGGRSLVPLELRAACRPDEGCLRQILVARHVEHPLGIRFVMQQADGGGIACKGRLGERVNV
eukprot:scaffold291929_cov28-Tisochrysis_lutea.AAC.1